MPEKEIKIGVKEGGGPLPGYRWSVLILDMAFDEAMNFLNEDQYEHLAAQVRELAGTDDPTHSATVDVRPIEDFYEIRDKGGALGGLNVRVFFHLDKKQSSILVLGAAKKQNNGPTPAGDKIRMRRRKRKYENGEFSGA